MSTWEKLLPQLTASLRPFMSLQAKIYSCRSDIFTKTWRSVQSWDMSRFRKSAETNRININILLTRLRVVSEKTIGSKIIFESRSRILKWVPVLWIPKTLSRMPIPCDNHKWKSLKSGPGFLSITSFTCLQKVLAHYLLSHFYNSEILVKVVKRLSIDF